MLSLAKRSPYRVWVTRGRAGYHLGKNLLHAREIGTYFAEALRTLRLVHGSGRDMFTSCTDEDNGVSLCRGLGSGRERRCRNDLENPMSVWHET